MYSTSGASERARQPAIIHRLADACTRAVASVLADRPELIFVSAVKGVEEGTGDRYTGGSGVLKICFLVGSEWRGVPRSRDRDNYGTSGRFIGTMEGEKERRNAGRGGGEDRSGRNFRPEESSRE